MLVHRSTAENREYGGFIYESSPLNFKYTEAVAGEVGKDTLDISKFNKPPAGKREIAIYHTHYGYDYAVSWFSDPDYWTASGNHLAIYLETSSYLIKVWSEDRPERIVR